MSNTRGPKQRIILLGVTFNVVGFGMNNFIRGEGNPQIAMLTMLIGAFLNVILDYVFIFIFNMGVQGAALATIISQFVSALWVLYYFYSKKSVLSIQRKLSPYNCVKLVSPWNKRSHFLCPSVRMKLQP